MKKSNFIVCGIIILFIVLFYTSIFVFKKNSNNNYQLIVNNQIIDIININENCIYNVESNGEIILIYKNKQLINKIDSNNKIIKNTILVENKTIKMIEANCKGKDCTYMIIDENRNLPIICTNGVIVSIIRENNDVDINI